MSHYPKKRYSQNWLTDEMTFMRIIDTIHPTHERHLVEIGPGQGALTAYLLPLVKRLDAIEIDPHLVKELQQRFKQQAAFYLHQADALAFDLKTIAAPNEKLAVVGNLPYHISTPLLFHLFDQLNLIDMMCFLLQKEVVERLVAPVGGHDYGRLSVMAQYFCTNELVFTLGPEAFYPPPRVDSALVLMRPRQDRLLNAKNLTVFSKVIKQAFNYRRKTVHNSLGPLIPISVFTELNINPQKRPQELTVNDYIQLSNWLEDKNN